MDLNKSDTCGGKFGRLYEVMIKQPKRFSLMWFYGAFRCPLASLAILLLSSSVGLCLSRNTFEAQQDSNVAGAERNFDEGQQLLTQGTTISEHKAIEKFTEAARLWRSAGDKRHEAIALSFIGKIYDLLGEKPIALDY